VTGAARNPSRWELHLLRHADAGDPAAWPGDDADRPLSPKGERQAERLGSFLADRGLTPDAIISSPLARARKTAEIVGRRLGVEVAPDERLAGPLGLAVLDQVLADAGRPTQPILVGHDPDFSELLTILSGAELSMRKGAFARLEIRGAVATGRATLRWLIPPDALAPHG
jgi:phosphohistidine phosphatase